MKKIISILIFGSAFVILMGLGSWQIQRLTWKNNLIAQLNQAYAHGEKILYDFEDFKIVDNDLPILYGAVQGRFDYGREILLGPRPFDGAVGYNLITPLNLERGGVILVNRGFLSADKIEDIAQTHIKGVIKISGLIRAPDWNSFTPDNSPENNVWTKLDIAQIAQAKDIQNIAPLILYAEKSSPEFSALKMNEEKWMPRNKHLQYAFFWFSMAGVLCGVFGLYAYQRRQK